MGKLCRVGLAVAYFVAMTGVTSATTTDDRAELDQRQAIDQIALTADAKRLVIVDGREDVIVRHIADRSKPVAIAVHERARAYLVQPTPSPSRVLIAANMGGGQSSIFLLDLDRGSSDHKLALPGTVKAFFKDESVAAIARDAPNVLVCYEIATARMISLQSPGKKILQA